MALRILRTDDDPILRKKAREITEITDNIRELAQDMIETMNDAEGVGLAGPQVGILRRIAVIDVGDGPTVMINPVLTKSEGTQCELEGCLSFPDATGKVIRPAYAEATYTDLDGNEQVLAGDGLLARAISHELDHLDGICFIDKVVEE